MRISDADRTRAVEELRRHCEAGRLDLEAYAGRVAEALEAETLADIDHALRDLPRVGIADPAADPPLLAPGGRRRDRSSGSHGPGPGRAGAGSTGRRRLDAWRARAVVLLTVLVVAVGACFLALAHWIWAVVLVVGWIVGVIQGRIRVR